MEVAVALVLACLAPQDGDRIHVPEIDEPFRRKVEAAEASRNEDLLFELYAFARTRYANRLMRPGAAPDRWLPAPLVLAAKVPRRSLPRIEALEATANAEGDGGRELEALRGWSRALEARPSPEIAARLGLAHALRGDTVALEALRSRVDGQELQGSVVVGGVSCELSLFLDLLQPRPPRRDPPPPPGEGPTNEIPLGSYDFAEDGRMFGQGLGASIPAVAGPEGEETIVVTNGQRILAIDAARAEGGSLADAVLWRWPDEKPVRSWTPAPYPGAQPCVGAVVEGSRVYAAMLTRAAQTPQQVGRRPERFEGPAAIRAFDLQTGALLWDTDTAEFMESVPFGRRNFGFGAPPLARGDRLYAAAMTSPLVERECWVVCLDADTGEPRWCTSVASAPPRSPRQASTSVVTFAEQGGTIVVQTNFGVVAALDSDTGAFEWLATYDRAAILRPAASPPVILGSVVYVLPQDAPQLLAFDRWSGLRIPLAERSAPIPWADIVHLAGRADEWLVFSGTKNVAFRPRDGQGVALADSDGGRVGRGAIAEGRVYLPARSGLAVYDASTWAQISSIPWSESADAGNLVATGGLCLHLSDRLDLYTGAAALARRFAPRLGRPDGARRLARILEAAGRPREALPHYRRALEMWEKDPAWRETAEGLRRKIEALEKD